MAVAQPNQWLLQSPTPTVQWFPATRWNCATTQTRASVISRAFCGSTMGNGQIFYFGGAHRSYPGNDVSLYDVATNQWLADPTEPQCIHACCGEISPSSTCDDLPVGCGTSGSAPTCLRGSCVADIGGCGAQKGAFRCNGGTNDGDLCAQDSECAGGACTVGMPTPGVVCTTCRPYSEHTYQHQAYNPVRGKFLFVTAGCGQYGSGTYEYDPSTRAWSWLQRPPPAAPDQSQASLIWDPVTSVMTYFVWNAGVRRFNYATNAWSNYDNYWPLPNNPNRMSVSSWDENASRAIVSFEGVRWFEYNPTTTGAAAWAEITNVPVELDSYCGGGGAVPCFTGSLTYDETNQRTIVLGQENANRTLALWAYDAVGNTWTKLTVASAPVAGSGNPGMGEYGHLHYDGGTAALWFLGAHNNNAWSGGAAGTVPLYKIALDLGNPLPTHTPTNTPLPTNTPTRTFTPTATPPPNPTSTLPPCPNGGITRLVGPGRPLTLPSQAAAIVQTGDCIDIDAGFYPNDVATWPASADNIRIRGVGGTAALEVQNGTISQGKGIWVIDGDNTTIENVSFACATDRPANQHCSGMLVGADPSAAIRLQAPGLTVRNCLFRDNDNGILGGPDGTVSTPPSGHVLIEHSEFWRNGYGAGLEHNVYLTRLNAEVTFRYNYSHGVLLGHLLKSRAALNRVYHNRITAEDHGYDSPIADKDCAGNNAGHCASSVAIEIPCGGRAYIVGNVIEQAALSDSPDPIKFAAEINTNLNSNCIQPPLTPELYVVNNTIVSKFPAGLGATRFIRWGYYQSGVPHAFGTTPLLWHKNNLFIGPAGAVQTAWPSTGTVVATTNLLLTTATGTLLSEPTYDYHLATGASAINAGTAPGTDAHGIDLTPVQHYVYDRTFTARPSDGTLDIGAFEYVASATAFPTRTVTPTNTPTTSPTFSATPATPLYCSVGQTEHVYRIKPEEYLDDGVVQKVGATYLSLGSPTVFDTQYNQTEVLVRRDHQAAGSPPYKVSVVLFRWDTTLRPDGTSWPAGSEMVGAFVRPFWLSGGSGPRQMTWEWYEWPGTLSANDWIVGSAQAPDSPWAATVNRITSSGRETIALANGDLNVSQNGYTGLRLTFVDTTAPIAEENQKYVRTADGYSSAGNRSAELVVCSQQAAGVPTETPTPTATVTQTASVTPTTDDCVCEANGQCLCFSSTPQEQCVCFRRMEGTPGP